jgi:hypothetical protein
MLVPGIGAGNDVIGSDPRIGRSARTRQRQPDLHARRVIGREDLRVCRTPVNRATATLRDGSGLPATGRQGAEYLWVCRDLLWPLIASANR